MQSEVKIITGRDGWHFAVFDPKNPQAAVEYTRRRQEGPTSLWLEMGGIHNDLPIESLTSIPGIEDVKNIHVMGSGWVDLNIVQELWHIQKLNFGFERSHFDFASFANLQEVSGVWSPFWANLENCRRLRSFRVSNFASSLDCLPNAASLTRLSFIQPRFASLCGIEKSLSLGSLEISLGSMLSDISALASVSGTLEVLELDVCRKISSFEVIGQLNMLAHLALTDCSPLPSLGFVRNLPRLRDLSVYGTRVSDNDLSHAVNHRCLRAFHADNRRSYAPRVATVDAMLATRPRDA